MYGGLTPDELALIDDILGENSDSSQQESSIIPPLPLKEKPKPLSIPSGGRYQSKSGLNRAPPSPIRAIASKSTKKCEVACIGGPDLKPGMTVDPLSPRFCSNLICVSCDHKVLRFPNSQWTPGTDYLFLRNNYPNAVQRNLIPAHGICAYCCQCKFCDERSVKHLSSFDNTWACRGHY